ncbi:regulation of nuclear pre-mRNA domain-containing protein 2 isoform X2 [Cajanus cajan]|uniref:regulation of nuclear pre-mRNA domain-containing protein 2 isoform X2 n=1 Tax=Cajanus cajan TaxID=3821 RepID=UPI00098DD410|nr:regulation of nuclear pre-mRNA domain-containing protein 2 isoform X2 [Cajanus cajan]
MSNNIFDGQILAEKLLKLNNSQQSIESLSHWCISHRKRAKEIVETWDKLFNASQKEQGISFLYLANDILQNSRRKGSEFVNEFWKVLPVALRHVYESGDEHGRKVVNRLKLAVGCLPEKILTAFQPVLDDHLNEEVALNNCNAALRDVVKVVEDVENTLAQGNQLGSTLVNDLHEMEKKLKQYMEQLENAEAARASLLSQLKHALQEQESRQELVCAQLLVARGQIEKAVGLRKRLNQVAETTDPSQPTFVQSSISFSPFQTTDDDNKKAAAAAVAAKLAASASSAQMLTSVLSSLVAEEAASLNGNLKSTAFSSGLPIFNPEKRPKLEKPTPVVDVNSPDMANSSFYATIQQQPSLANVPLAPSVGMQTVSQANQLQAAFASAPTPPPHSPANQPPNQYVQFQSTGLMAGGIPYGYGSSNLPPPPPPPLPPHVAMGLSIPGTQPAQQQQQSSPGGFYRPPGIGFYGQSNPSTPPPVPRQ